MSEKTKQDRILSAESLQRIEACINQARLGNMSPLDVWKSFREWRDSLPTARTLDVAAVVIAGHAEPAPALESQDARDAAPVGPLANRVWELEQSLSGCRMLKDDWQDRAEKAETDLKKYKQFHDVFVAVEMKMKKLVQVTEVEGEDLVGLMGQRITLFCLNYIYTGLLVGVNEQFVKLQDPSIVYETGAFTDKSWKDAQKLPHELYVMLAAVESFGIVKE